MAPPTRYTFISDATDEFPNNKNNSFKVRLPNQLQLPGENWHASLWSISVPDEAFTNSSILTEGSNFIHFAYTTYLLDNYQSGASEYARLTPRRFEHRLENWRLFSNHYPVTTGTDFWRNVQQGIIYVIQNRLKNNYVSNHAGTIRHALYEEWAPLITVKDNSFVLPAVSTYSVADTGGNLRSWFGIKLDVAAKFGFLNTNQTDLGSNVYGEYATYDETGGSIRDSVVNTYQVKGKTQKVIQTRDVDTTGPRSEWFTINRSAGFVYFSRAIQWTFVRLNESFEALLNTKETVMV